MQEIQSTKLPFKLKIVDIILRGVFSLQKENQYPIILKVFQIICFSTLINDFLKLGNGS